MRLPSVLAAAAIVTFATNARADGDDDLQRADGSDECHALQEQNEHERTAYEKTQPAVPYKYPVPDLVVNAPWGAFFNGLGSSGNLILASLIPHIGAQYRGGSPAILVSFPWSILVFGPMYSCSRIKTTYIVSGHRVHRILLEPGINSGALGTGVHVRPGYRFIWHPSSWVVGPGIGIGSTLELLGNKEKFRYSIGPELVAHFGNCCSSSYFTFAVRYDHYLKGVNNNIIGGSLGYTFF